MSWPTEDLHGSPGPLSGTRVLELSRIIAGPLAAMYLADLGADVIKVERPSGDEMRTSGPGKWSGVGSTFLAINRNKRSVVLDLNDAADRELLMGLVVDSDVLIENYRPGIMERWGLDFQRLSEKNPHLVMCSITGFGSHGASAALGANNLIAEAFGGTMGVSQGVEERMRLGPPMTDFFTGTSAALAITAALMVPREKRKATHIETSLLESQAMIMSGYILGYLGSGVDPKPDDGLPLTVPNQAFQTSDKRIVLAVNSGQMWDRLCVAVGMPEWLEREDFATNAERMQHQEEIVGTLDDIIARRSRAQWLETFAEARVTAGPINSVADLVVHSQVAALDLLEPTPSDGIPELLGVRLPFTFDGRPVAAGPHRPPPSLGQHTSTVRQAK